MENKPKSGWPYPAAYLANSAQTAEEALADVTDLVVLAHPDDAEIGVPDVLQAALRDPSRKVAVVIVTDGRGAPRQGEFADLTDQQLADVRLQEQVNAAKAGKYHLLAMLQHPDAKGSPLGQGLITNDVARLMRACPKLQQVVTHNPFDKHNGHLHVFAATLNALRSLPPERQDAITAFRGIEVWGEISWLEGSKNLIMTPLDKETLALQAKLLDMHRSQVEGAKPYTHAVRGRQAARGTFENPYVTNATDDILMSVDLRDFIREPDLTVKGFIARECAEHAQRLEARTQNLDAPQTIVGDAQDAGLVGQLRPLAR